MKLFFTLYAIFSTLRKCIEEIINSIAEKLSDVLGGTLFIIAVLPFLILEEFFDFIVNQFKMTKNFKKNYKLFKEWYSEYKKEAKND